MPHGRPAKRRRLTPPIDDSKTSETVKASDLFARAANWDLEQDYEQKRRSKKTKESTKLPIKTAEGTIQQVRAEQVNKDDDDSDSFLGSDTDDEAAGNDVETPPTETEPVHQIPARQQVLAAKEEIARLATFLNEDPEEHAGAFKRLAQLFLSTIASRGSETRASCSSGCVQRCDTRLSDTQL